MGRSRSARGDVWKAEGGEMESRRTRTRRRWRTRRRRAITVECSRSPVGIWEGESLGGLFVKAREHLPLGPLTLPSSSSSSFSQNNPSIPPSPSSHKHSASLRRLFRHSSMLYCYSSELFSGGIYCVHMARAQPVYGAPCPSARGRSDVIRQIFANLCLLEVLSMLSIFFRLRNETM